MRSRSPRAISAEEENTEKIVTVDAVTLDRLQRVLGVLDENLTTIARELSLMTRIDGTKIVLMGEEAETGGAVIGNLLSGGGPGGPNDTSWLMS